MPSLAQKLKYTGPHPDLFGDLPHDQQLELLEIFELLRKLPNGLAITVGNLKGGVSKTTTVIYLSLMLGLTGDEVLVVDGDGTNRSALLWQSATVEWPTNVKVVSWAGQDSKGMTITGKEMVSRVRRVRDKFRHILIDTGPQVHDYLAGALRVTSDFIVTSSPRPMDMAQITKSVDLASQVAEVKPEDDPLYVTVLFAQAKRGTNSLKGAFADMREKEVPVFDQAITNREHYAMSAGTVPINFDEYVSVLRQLVEAQV